MTGSKNYLITIGSSSMDTYFDIPHWPTLGDKVMAEFKEVKVGGLVSNAACTMAACGFETYMIDIVSEDSSEIVLSELRSFGVNTDYITVQGGYKQSSTNIYIVGGEKVIFVNKRRKVLDLNDEQRELIQGATALYSVLTEIKNIVTYEEIIDSLRKKGGKIAFDMEPPVFSDSAEDIMLLEKADILFFNDMGIDKYRKHLSEDQAVRHLLSSGVNTVVVTRAAKGCSVWTQQGRTDFAGLPVEVVDTTGAGDAFNSVFLYGWLNGWETEKCAKMANAAGARAVTTVGPKSGAVPLCTLEGFLNLYTPEVT